MLKHELSKQLRTPFVWVFAAVCLLLNSFAIMSQGYSIGKVMQQCELAGIIGTTDISGADISVISDELMPEEAVRLQYSHSGYAGTELAYLLKMQAMKTSDSARDVIYDTVLPAFEQRITEINENGDYRYLNGGKPLHDLMFTVLLLLCAAEAVPFALLIAAKCGGHEYLAGTTLIVYSSKKGRSLAGTKLFAALILTELMFITEVLISFAVFLICCPCFALLGSPMLLNEDMAVLFPWAEISVIGFFLVQVIIAAAVIALFVPVGYIFFALFIKFRGNMFLGAAASLIFVILLYAVYALTPTALHGFIMMSEPVLLIMNRVGYWFSASFRSVCLPCFELYAITGWGALLTVLSVVAIKRIKKVSL